MSAPDQLSQVQANLDRARDEYFQHRAALAEALRGQDSELLPRLITHAEELGVERTLDALKTEPDIFSLASAEELPIAQLAVLLPKIADLSWEMGALVGERENLLGRLTLAQGRVVSIDGREATVDLTNQRLRFADRTDEAFVLEAVETRNEPPTKAPTKRRRRDRDR